VEVDTFSFKAMDAHGDLDTHTLDRSLAFDMQQSKSLNVAMDAEYAKERLAPVRAMLIQRAEAARANGWNASRWTATWNDPAFRRRVAQFDRAWARHGVKAATLLLISDIFEFDIEDELHELMNDQVPEMSDDAQLLKEVIIDWAEFQGDILNPKSELLVSAELLKLYNATREERGLPRVATVTAPLRELDFSTRAQDWVPGKRNMAGPNRGKAVIRPFAKIEAWRRERGEPAGDHIARVAGVAQQGGRMQPLQPLQPPTDDPWAVKDESRDGFEDPAPGPSPGARATKKVEDSES
jgi:hypothetical protein